MAKQTIIHVKCCTDWSVCLCVFLSIAFVQFLFAKFIHLRCATIYDVEIKLFKVASCFLSACRLDRDAVVLHLAVVRPSVGRLHTNVRSPGLPRQRPTRHRHPHNQLHRVIVRADPRVAVPDPQSHVRLRLEPHLHGVVAGHRRLFSEGPQVPRAGHQHSALRISHRSVYVYARMNNGYLCATNRTQQGRATRCGDTSCRYHHYSDLLLLLRTE